ncbi:diacylglycerol acyltransferase, partial [Oesophagostomum dentatum]
MLGVDFSPMTEPWDQRNLVLGTLYHFFIVYWLAIVGFILPVVLVLTFQWHILLLYGIWYLYDRNSPKRGGYTSEWVQGWTVHKWFANYFPVRLHKTAELSPSHNYIVACHPHGIISMAVFANFATYGTDKNEK